jgi:hypothetical protein
VTPGIERLIVDLPAHPALSGALLVERQAAPIYLKAISFSGSRRTGN